MPVVPDHFALTDVNILWIALIVYIMIMFFAYFFRIKWLMMLAGFLWFVPLSYVDDSFIELTSIGMFLSHAFLLLYKKDEEEF